MRGGRGGDQFLFSRTDPSNLPLLKLYLIFFSDRFMEGSRGWHYKGFFSINKTIFVNSVHIWCSFWHFFVALFESKLAYLALFELKVGAFLWKKSGNPGLKQKGWSRSSFGWRGWASSWWVQLKADINPHARHPWFKVLGPQAKDFKYKKVLSASFTSCLFSN